MQSRIRQLLDGESVKAPAWDWLGIRLIAAEPGKATGEMQCRPEMRNHQGVVHGGFISTLADSIMGVAMATLLPEASRQFSFDLKLSFVSPAQPEDLLTGIAGVVHAGRRTGVTECRIEAPGGRLVAAATASFVLYRAGNNEQDAGR